MMPQEVDYAGLKEVMSRYDPLDELRYFLDCETGKVLVIDDEIERQARALADFDWGIVRRPAHLRTRQSKADGQ